MSHLKKIRCKKRYFVKYFVVSFLLMLLACLILMLFRQGIYHFISHFYSMLSYKAFLMHIMCSMCLWKLLIIQFALAPAIALHCLEKTAEKEDLEYDYDADRR